MALFHSFLWPSNIPLCLCTTSYLSIYLSMDVSVVSISWLLWIMLLWPLEKVYLFELEFSPDMCSGMGLLDHIFCCCCCSVTKSCLTLCNFMDCSTQASLSFTISPSLLKLISIESVMPRSHLILCHPFSSCLQSFPASGSFPMSWLFTSGSQILELQHQSFQSIFRVDFL